MDPADLLASGEVGDGSGDSHDAVEAACREPHRLGGLGEEAAAGLVGPCDGLQALAVDLRVGPDPLPFEPLRLDGSGGRDPAGDLGGAFGRGRKDEVGCPTQKLVPQKEV